LSPRKVSGQKMVEQEETRDSYYRRDALMARPSKTFMACLFTDSRRGWRAPAQWSCINIMQGVGVGIHPPGRAYLPILTTVRQAADRCSPLPEKAFLCSIKFCRVSISYSYSACPVAFYPVWLVTFRGASYAGSLFLLHVSCHIHNLSIHI